MDYGIFEILQLLGSLGIFLFGMKLMSESLQKVAGNKLRHFLSAMTSNRFKGIFTGFVVTSIIQSSSATTVMMVSFVNAGLLGLLESIGVIMGANIGTTITAWLISILGFKVKMSAIAIPLIGIGFPLVFSKQNKRKSIGEIIIGFAFIFIGLQYIKESVPDIRNNPEVLFFLKTYTSGGVLSYLLFLFIGTVLTVVIQSSSATMALTLVLCHRGIIPFDMAAAMVLGENIGTTITANLAALVTNISARRAALAHLIFNLFGVFWISLFFTPALKLISIININMGGMNPYVELAAIPLSLSLFHTLFNITNTLTLVWFAPLIEKTVVKLIPQKESDEEYRLKYISVGLLDTSELSILQAKKEIVVYANRAKTMFDTVKELWLAEKNKAFVKARARIEKYEDILDRMEVEIASYLTRISRGEISTNGSARVVAMLHIIGDIESIADCCFNLSRMIARKKEQDVKFSKKQDKNILSMFELANTAMETMQNNLTVDLKDVNLQKADLIESEINHLRDSLKSEFVLNLKDGKINYVQGSIYNDLISECEKLADYAINVSEALKGKS